MGKRKASWDEQGTKSRRVHTTLRAELPGVGTGDHAVWEFNEGQESPCSPPSFGCHDEVMVPAAQARIASTGYACKVSDQFLETSGTAPEEILLIWT